MITRKYFFDSVRETLFHGSLTLSQVKGMLSILQEWEVRGLTDLRHLSYLLATTLHETARTMQPIEEYGKGKGYKYGKPVNGKVYYGRGFVQITWDYNYKKFGLLETPEKALQLSTATRILFDGMAKGMFTGKKLSDYFNSKTTDPINARRIINGTDKAALIASYYHKFYEALNP